MYRLLLLMEAAAYRVNRTTRDWTYFNKTVTVGLCVFGIVAGLIQRYTHRYKVSIESGATILPLLTHVI